jgi:hypothetical protein
VLSAAPEPAVRDGRRALELLHALPSSAQGSLGFGVGMAMALAETGDYTQAVTWQEDVLRHPAATDERMRVGFRELLLAYQQHKPSRRPWSGAEPMELDPGF